VGTIVIFNGSGSRDDGIITKFIWSFDYNGDRLSLTGKEAYFKFELGGVYDVTLWVCDQAKNTDMDVVKITVIDTGIVNGRVNDSEGNPLKGVTIEIVASGESWYLPIVSANGSFSVAIKAGSFRWRAVKEGYVTVNGTSNVELMKVANLLITMFPIPKEEEEGETSPLVYLGLILAVIAILIAFIAIVAIKLKDPSPKYLPEDRPKAIPHTPSPDISVFLFEDEDEW
jgi:hypothetical protein